jgi:1-aminocyclopropane-1-carboxylate deaminase
LRAGFPILRWFINRMLTSLPNPWKIDLSLLKSNNTQPHLGGNKYHKLSGYLDAASRQGVGHLVTMAGAHSNHLRAFAALAREGAFRFTAIIRGDELSDTSRWSETIRYAVASGVDCRFITRQAYRALRGAAVAERGSIVPGVDLTAAMFIPEGGLGPLGVAGASEWATAARSFDRIYVAAATGTTAASFSMENPQATIVAVMAVGNAPDLKTNLAELTNNAPNYVVDDAHTCGGFARTTRALVRLCKVYSAAWNVVIDTSYMGKVLLALRSDVRRQAMGKRNLLVYTYNE